jgi:hypothetical protein
LHKIEQLLYLQGGLHPTGKPVGFTPQGYNDIIISRYPNFSHLKF